MRVALPLARYRESGGGSCYHLLSFLFLYKFFSKTRSLTLGIRASFLIICGVDLP